MGNIVDTIGDFVASQASDSMIGRRVTTMMAMRRRRRHGDDDDASGHTYTYPTKSGSAFFSPHFIMGGERFETYQPEAFLFGENLDLNFLGSRPTPFPYAAPLPNEPTRVLRSLLNIRKESLRFIRVTDPHLIPKNHHHTTTKTTKKTTTTTTTTTTTEATTIMIGKDKGDDEEEEDEVISGKDIKTSNNGSSTSPVVPQVPVLQEKDEERAGETEAQVEEEEEEEEEKYHYNIEFMFDSDVTCSIGIYYFAHEQVTSTGITYVPKDWSICSDSLTFTRGAGQSFSQSAHVFTPTNFSEIDLMYSAFDEQGFFDPKVPFPVVIHMSSLEGPEPRQSHSLIAIIERNTNGSYSLKPFVQKLFIDGLSYLMQEIYGIENKIMTTTTNTTSISPTGPGAGDVVIGSKFMSLEEEEEYNSAACECVVCLSDSRDTLILPCRHLCLCYACADSLRYQANNCPICRAPFRALLQIRAVRSKSSMMSMLKMSSPPSASSKTTDRTIIDHSATQFHASSPTAAAAAGAGDQNSNANTIVAAAALTPVGFESLPLVEALNGPFFTTSSSSSSSAHHIRSSYFTGPPDIERTPVSVRKNHHHHHQHRHRHPHQHNIKSSSHNNHTSTANTAGGVVVIPSQDQPNLQQNSSNRSSQTHHHSNHQHHHQQQQHSGHHNHPSTIQMGLQAHNQNMHLNTGLESSRHREQQQSETIALPSRRMIRTNPNICMTTMGQSGGMSMSQTLPILSPPEPAPVDWKLDTSRCLDTELNNRRRSRKVSDDEDEEEGEEEEEDSMSSSTGSSGFVAHETSRLLPLPVPTINTSASANITTNTNAEDTMEMVQFLQRSSSTRSTTGTTNCRTSPKVKQLLIRNDHPLMSTGSGSEVPCNYAVIRASDDGDDDDEDEDYDDEEEEEEDCDAGRSANNSAPHFTATSTATTSAIAKKESNTNSSNNNNNDGDDDASNSRRSQIIVTGSDDHAYDYHDDDNDEDIIDAAVGHDDERVFTGLNVGLSYPHSVTSLNGSQMASNTTTATVSPSPTMTTTTRTAASNAAKEIN